MRRPTASVRAKPLSGARVLLAEDDPDGREVVAELLALEGALVTPAAGGHEALELFRRERPDVLVSDLRMPDGDGYELVGNIRDLPAELGKLTPAVALSASENARAAILAGYHAFVPKPVEIEQLVGVIKDFFEPSDAVRPNAAPWTVSAPRPGRIVLTFMGDVTAADMRHLMGALLVHLENGPCEIVDDLRQLGSFSPSVASIAERAVWRHRHNIRRVLVVGGSALARTITAAACKVINVPFVFAQSIEEFDQTTGS